ncbi:hypothetical protein DY218_08815 [Streptomyces triticagri]|uniref:Uncharacterized protein n=1 Tax=Streptomyces triticagri TaxID=2293568 RepID=A0A372M815_9ACTN|nr:hypothetical protein [Streptomyces triticagri]RFU87078.1 hypothetical protein DY218_08815 [Streptomyces triticagri]
MPTVRTLSAHPARWAGPAVLAVGAVLCVIGWYGVSGERFTARQIPYLASCSLPGAALIVAGAVLLAQSRNLRAADRVEELYRLLVTSAPDAPDRTGRLPVATSDELVRVPGGTLWHRADCPLAAGKPDVVRLDDGGRPAGAGADETYDGLTPCPVCEPDSGPEPATAPES